MRFHGKKMPYVILGQGRKRNIRAAQIKYILKPLSNYTANPALWFGPATAT